MIYVLGGNPMNSCNLVITLTGIACTLANCLSEEELELLSTSLVQLGETLETIIANENFQRECCNRSERCNDPCSSQCDC